MNDFEKKLLRLKECLQVLEDQQVAVALNMSKAAFSNRKQSGSFPDERVVGLKSRFPNLDISYVLTGLRLQGEAAKSFDLTYQRSAAKDDGMMLRAANGVAHYAEAELARAPRLRGLMDLLDWCTEDDLDLLTVLAARLASTSGLRRVRNRPNVDETNGVEAGREQVPAPFEPSRGISGTTVEKNVGSEVAEATVQAGKPTASAKGNLGRRPAAKKRAK